MATAGQAGLYGPAGLAYDAEGRLYTSWSGSNLITVHDSSDKEIARWDSGLNQPRGLAVGRDGRVYVCDTGNHRIVCFNPDGTVNRVWGKQGKGDGEFSSPYGIFVDESGHVLVADTYNSRIQWFDADGKFLKKVGEDGPGREQFHEPAGFAYKDGLLFIASGWNSRIDVYHYNPETMDFRHVGGDQDDRENDRGIIWGFWVCGDVAILKDGSLVGIDRNNGWIGRWDAEDYKKELKRFNGGNYGMLRNPSAVIAAPDGWIAIADTGNDRVLMLAPELEDLFRPLITNISQTSAFFEWRSADPESSDSLLLKSRGLDHNGSPMEESTHGPYIAGAGIGKSGLRDLAPGTGYVFAIDTPAWAARVIKNGDRGYWRPFGFATKAPKGKKNILNLPIAIIIRTDIWNPEGSGPNTAPQPSPARVEGEWRDGQVPVDRGQPPGEDYMEYVRKEFEDARLFYFINSHCRLNLEYEWFIYDKPLTRDEQWPGEAGDDELMKAKGKTREDFASLIIVDVERRYDPKRKAYYLQGSGGGTWGAHYYGLNKKMQPGRSSFLGGSDLAWLVAHEFHHSLDSMFAESGYGEYPFNHFAEYQHGGYPGPFGEHWDGNAYILRVWPEQAWFYNLFGYVSTTDDRDEDGVPDDNPKLPFDEKRWGSDADKKSTAGDGIADLTRLMFSNWVPATLGSINNASVNLIHPGPYKTSQTGLGIPDKERRDPCVPFREGIPFGSPDLAKSFNEEPEWARPWGSFAGEGFGGTVYAVWDETGIYFNFVFQNKKPVSMQIQTDFALDGIYQGQDNYHLRIDCSLDEPNIQDFHVQNGAKDRWPFADKELVAKESITVAGGEGPEGYEVRVKLPWHLKSGLTCRPGDTYGFAFTFLVKEGVNQWNGDRIHISAFEPYKLFWVTLRR